MRIPYCRYGVAIHLPKQAANYLVHRGSPEKALLVQIATGISLTIVTPIYDNPKIMLAG